MVTETSFLAEMWKKPEGVQTEKGSHPSPLITLVREGLTRMYVTSTLLESSLLWREEVKGAFYFGFECLDSNLVQYNNKAIDIKVNGI